jgi:hypothetical protein
VKSADPCARGSVPTSEEILRIVLLSRPPHVLVLEVLEGLLDVLLLALERRAGGAQLGDDVLLDLRELAVAVVLLVLRVSRAHLVERDLAHACSDALRERHLLEGALLAVHRLRHLLLRLEQRLDGALPEEERLDHVVLAHFLAAALDHEDGLAIGRQDDVDVALVALRLAGVGDELPVDPAHADARELEREGNVADRHGERSAGEREHVGVVGGVCREHRGDHLRVVLVALGEERPQRAVDEPRDQRLPLGEPAFAPEEAPGNAPGSGESLLVIDGEGKKVEARLRLLRGDRGHQHHAVAAADDDRSVRLLRHPAGLERDALAPDFRGDGNRFCHVQRPFARAPPTLRSASSMGVGSGDRWILIAGANRVRCSDEGPSRLPGTTRLSKTAEGHLPMPLVKDFSYLRIPRPSMSLRYRVVSLDLR